MSSNTVFFKGIRLLWINSGCRDFCHPVSLYNDSGSTLKIILTTVKISSRDWNPSFTNSYLPSEYANFRDLLANKLKKKNAELGCHHALRWLGGGTDSAVPSSPQYWLPQGEIAGGLHSQWKIISSGTSLPVCLPELTPLSRSGGNKGTNKIMGESPHNPDFGKLQSK